MVSKSKTIEQTAREHGTGGWQTLEDMVKFGEAIRAQTIEELAGMDVKPVANLYKHSVSSGSIAAPMEEWRVTRNPVTAGVSVRPLYTLDQLAATQVQTRGLMQQLVDAIAPISAYGLPGSRDDQQGIAQAALAAGRAWLEGGGE